MPSWMLEGFDGILAVDIGGTNIRAGLVETKLKKAKDLSKAAVFASEIWRHGDEKTKRDEAVGRLIDMLKDHIELAEKEGLKLAPVVGIGCPGIIREDGSIETGAQNLPGNWESSRFNLANCIREAIPLIADHETAVVIHNDAVVQGLSELPVDAGLRQVGCADHRHRPGQRALHQSAQERQSEALRFPLPLTAYRTWQHTLRPGKSPRSARRWLTGQPSIQ